MTDEPVWVVVLVMALVVPLLLAQGSWLFIDARKRGAHPWFWGIWGLFQFPWPLILYLLIVRKGVFRNRKRSGRGG